MTRCVTKLPAVQSPTHTTVFMHKEYLFSLNGLLEWAEKLGIMSKIWKVLKRPIHQTQLC